MSSSPASERRTVLLATSSALPEGEERGTPHLLDAFADAGLDARWVVWDDPTVDWQSADLVAVRSTWDYDGRREEFLAWARSVGAALVNPAPVLAWNTDKSYLCGLADAGVPVVPTEVAAGRAGLAAPIARWGTAVVKPAVGAGGRGVQVVTSAEEVSGEGPWVVQPLVESVRTEGEVSVFVLGDEPVSQVAKRPAGGEIRVHEEYGGRTTRTPLTDEAADLARRAVAAARERFDGPLHYARVDQVRLADGGLAVSELEATEPGLYLDVVPENARAFAALVAGLVEV